MGCCSSSPADRIKLLSEKQQHHIAECCQAALLQSVPDQAFQWIITKLSRDMGKSQAQIFKMITTDTQPCGRIANKPDQVDGNRSLLQIFGSCEKKAKMFVMAKCEDDLKKSAKLELKTDEDVHDFVVAAVHSEIRKALEDRIDEILNPDGDGNENENENGDKDGMKRQKSGSNLKSNAQKSNTTSVEPTHHDDKPAVSKAQQQQQQQQQTKKNSSNAATSKTNNNNNNTTTSTKKNTTKASSTSASYANTKSSSASAARARQNIVQQKQKGDPPKQTGPTHEDNKWVACEDCEYYWNEYKELYYDPVKKLFYNEEIGKWLKTEPTVVVKK